MLLLVVEAQAAVEAALLKVEEEDHLGPERNLAPEVVPGRQPDRERVLERLWDAPLPQREVTCGKGAKRTLTNCSSDLIASSACW